MVRVQSVAAGGNVDAAAAYADAVLSGKTMFCRVYGVRTGADFKVILCGDTVAALTFYSQFTFTVEADICPGVDGSVNIFIIEFSGGDQRIFRSLRRGDKYLVSLHSVQGGPALICY